MTHTKGFYIKELRKIGIKKDPETNRHLSHTKTPKLRNMYFEYVLKQP